MKQFLFTVFLFFGILVAYAGGNGNIIQHGGENPVIAQPKTTNPNWVDKVLENQVVKRVLKTLDEVDSAKEWAGKSLSFAFGGIGVNIFANILNIGIGGLPLSVALIFSLLAWIFFINSIVLGNKATRQYKLQESQVGKGKAIAGKIISWICLIIGVVSTIIALKILGII